jgi:hypothetical protein
MRTTGLTHGDAHANVMLDLIVETANSRSCFQKEGESWDYAEVAK